jgi:hypothetical protein
MLPAPGPFWGGNMQEKIECQQQNFEQDFNGTALKKSQKGKTRKKYNWDLTVNFVSFENDDDRQRSYELWIESFFHFVN